MGAGTVYVVHHNDAVRDSLQALLEAYGYDVIAFASGEEFVREVRPDGVACLFLDVDMPGMSGLALLESARRELSHLPALMLADGLGAAARRHADHLGVRLLEKSVDADELLRAVEETMRAQLH